MHTYSTAITHTSLRSCPVEALNLASPALLLSPDDDDDDDDDDDEEDVITTRWSMADGEKTTSWAELGEGAELVGGAMGVMSRRRTYQRNQIGNIHVNKHYGTPVT